MTTEAAPQFSQEFIDSLVGIGAENLGAAADCEFWLVNSDTTERLRLATEEEATESFEASYGGHIHSDDYDHSVYVEVV